MAAALRTPPRYTPPCEHVIIQMSSGSFAVNVGEGTLGGIPPRSVGVLLLDLKQRIQASTGYAPALQRLFDETGRDQLADECAVAPGTTLLLSVPSSLREPQHPRKMARAHEVVPAAPRARLSSTFNCAHSSTWRDAQIVMAKFSQFSEDHALPLPDLIRALSVFKRMAERSVALRSRGLPRLQAALRAAPARKALDQVSANPTPGFCPSKRAPLQSIQN